MVHAGKWLHYLRCLQISQQIHELEATGAFAGRLDEERSPSPEPKYNEDGLRTNTRVQRLKAKLTADAQVLGGKHGLTRPSLLPLLLVSPP